MVSNDDRKMGRSIQQAMYRYLPGRWINFYIKSSRDGFSAYIQNWNSTPLEGANINRIKREVWHRLEALGDRTKRFAPLWNDSAWSVLTPKTSDVNSAIIAEVSPLLFFCSNPKCRKVVEYRNSDQFLKNYTNNMHCKYCNPSLPAIQRPAMTQVQMVYYCQCGWAGPVRKPHATCSCNAPLMQKNSYTYACTKCHRTYELHYICPECSAPLGPKNALDNAQFYSHSFNLIDLVDEEREHYINSTGNTKLCAFNPENATKSNIYATRMETEGVIFELDRRAILRWMVQNRIIMSVEYTEAISDAEVKAWFLRNCNQTSISAFGEIDDSVDYRLSAVFKLLHSISHELIRQAATISGLDKSSISEYIFAEIPAVFIYCQNTQGFNLGAMFSAMEAQLSVWITSAMEEIEQCIFDPVCRDESGACAGCLFLTDVSCHYMNKQLDRRLLTGYTRPDNTRVYGFWEEW